MISPGEVTVSIWSKYNPALKKTVTFSISEASAN